ncbi:MAG: 23S rRNA (uracil(1939)-C(5))-methyltransferase RlmD [Parasporobacterium sp.]|nr:23S rRNA (uracil(1939)-C(5))-methyltransferase RlmD [Parasporobacterium sp.]
MSSLFNGCGGCTYQKISYKKQLAIKSEEVTGLISRVYPDFEFEGIIPSPSETGYRNKMEFTFGDSCKDGPFSLGLHQKKSFMNIVDIRDCILVHPDMNIIRNAVRDHFAPFYENGEIDFRNNRTRRGYLRHLLLRRAEKTGEILAALVTASPEMSNVGGFDSEKEELLLTRFSGMLENLEREGNLEGKIKGILHITNDAASDVVRSDVTRILYGTEIISEEVLGLHFQISPFSFFQTNTSGAELLYEKAREYAAQAGISSSASEKTGVLFDLYSGTGTIAQLMAPSAEQVIGVEIVEEAVEAAKKSAKQNRVENVSFAAGDVLKVLDELPKPDAIILDPPREGINPKALGKILGYGVDSVVYVSCKPASLARDLESFKIAGYQLRKAACVDMFPQTPHVETVVLLSKGNISSEKIRVEFDLEDMDMSDFKDRATYDEIRKWVQEKYGFHVTNLNIAQLKKKHGIIERENYNKPKTPDSHQPGCPPEKQKAIEDALAHFQMI